VSGRGVIERYAERLPLSAHTPRITLGEGGTPCVESVSIARDLGVRSLHFKLEGLNPTGSFKDRGMVVAVAKALEAGSSGVVCASTGNTSASAAAYGARFGLRVGVLVPADGVAAGKLAQAQVHGAVVMSVGGGFDLALEAVRALCLRHPVTLVNSVNPFRIEGQKTAAFEIVDELGSVPDVVCLPVGNAANIAAYWRGFVEYESSGRMRALPRMIGAQAEGAAPLVRGEPVADPQTVASAIRIGNPASWRLAEAARDESEGLIDAVTDDEILRAQRDIAEREGIFCEPASAASLAVLRKAVRDGRVEREARAVCVLTGSGLKDVAAVADRLAPPVAVAADVDSIARALGLQA
jgi:threonine synthase